jgi:GH24 family phage-related lysozyme (muramidase)
MNIREFFTKILAPLFAPLAMRDEAPAAPAFANVESMIPTLPPTAPVTLADAVARKAAYLIKEFEGCKLTAYQDSGGVWTIGYGHTHGVTAGQTITQEQANAFFSADASPLIVTALQYFPQASEYEMAAWVSFAYNCGHTVLDWAKQGICVPTPGGFLVHGSAYGQVDVQGHLLPALQIRRQKESMLIRLSRA